MKILVPIKPVADPDNLNKVRLSGDAQSVVTDGLPRAINPYDEYALEAALRLNENGATKDKFGEIILVTLGPADSVSILHKALAKGGDRAILVECDDSALDTAVVARALKAVVEKESPDLVLMGKITVDSDSNAVGPYLAEALGWPAATMAMQLTTSDGGAHFRVGREVDSGILQLDIIPPAVVTVSDRIIHPSAIKNGVTPADFAYPQSDYGRLPSIFGVKAAKKKPMDKLSLSDLGIDTTLQCEYLQYALPPARSGETVFVSSAVELVEALHSQAKVL